MILKAYGRIKEKNIKFKITLVAMGNKMPAWVVAAIHDYQKRLQEQLQLSIIEIPLIKRGKSHDLQRILEKEHQLFQAAIPEDTRLIALEIKGESFSSEQLAAKFESLARINTRLCFLIGGPEGLSPEILRQCDERWSLSPLTLAHPLVRIILLEAIYRSWAILNHHPYHKASSHK